MAALAIGASMLGTAANVAGSIMEGNVNAANAIAESRAYKFNSQVAEQQAKNTRQVAVADASDFRRAQQARLASRKAAMAGSGIVATSGSPLLVDEKILANIEFSGARIINEGDIKSTRLLNESTLLKAQAKNARANAGYAKTAGYINAAGALASGVSNTLSTTSKFG